jgi:hypothetical protein
MSCPTDVGIYVSKSCDCRSIVKRRAFTLVELLVSVTLTLLVVFAIVQIFDVLGSNMRLGRALIEMSGQMRTVTNRLQQDLDNVTCQVKPWNDPESGSGYFTYIEGRTNDRDAVSVVAGQLIRMSDGIFDALDVDGDGSPDQDTHYGDWDDGLALTVRSPDRPFVGRMVTTVGGVTTVTTIQSQEAEVVWWVAFIDANNDGVCQTSETTLLLRRVFLVAPNLQAAIIELYDGDGTADGILHVEQSDISVRTVATVFDGPTVNLPVANTLADLTQPDARSAAQRSDLNENEEDDSTPDGVYGNAFPSILSVSNLDGTVVAGSLNAGVVFGDHVVLTDLLAFDIRAYDPLAPILSVNGISISPGDPGYPPPQNADNPVPRDDLRLILEDGSEDTAYGTANMIGRGAYVDLGYLVWWDYTGPNGPRIAFSGSESNYLASHSDLGAIGNWFAAGNPWGRISHFSGLPAFDDQVPRNNLRDPLERFWNPSTGLKELSNDVAYSGYFDVPTFYYDTWTSFYERDGINQDDDNNNNGIPDNGPPDLTPPPEIIDEGTDGLDSDGINGVDDPGERETSPPYPVDLRGIEVRIRMMDFNTRQVRQVSVVGDFVPE